MLARVPEMFRRVPASKTRLRRHLSPNVPYPPTHAQHSTSLIYLLCSRFTDTTAHIGSDDAPKASPQTKSLKTGPRPPLGRVDPRGLGLFPGPCLLLSGGDLEGDFQRIHPLFSREEPPRVVHRRAQCRGQCILLDQASLRARARRTPLTSSSLPHPRARRSPNSSRASPTPLPLPRRTLPTLACTVRAQLGVA